MPILALMSTKKDSGNDTSPSGNEIVMEKLGNRIKTLRLQKGYSSHEKFAYEHNFNRSQYFRYEHGEDLRFSTLLKIVTAFNMTMEEFFSQGFD